MLRDEGRNLEALRAAGVETPAVITAFEDFAVKVAVGERDAAVRAGIAHGKGLAFAGASEDERDFEEHRGGQVVAADFAAAQGGIPEIPEEAWIRGTGGIGLRLQHRSRRFAHLGHRIVVYGEVPSNDGNGPRNRPGRILALQAAPLPRGQRTLPVWRFGSIL